MKRNRHNDKLYGPVQSIHTRTITGPDVNDAAGERLQNSETCLYDSEGNLIEEAHYDSAGSLLHRITYKHKFDDVTEEVLYDQSDSPVLRTLYTYDSTGRLIKEQLYGADDSVTERRVITHNAKGQRIEEETLPRLSENLDSHYHVDFVVDVEGCDLLFEATDVNRIRKIYDANGDPIEISLHNVKGGRTGRVLFMYDQQSRLSEIQQYGWNGFYCGEDTKWRRLLQPLVVRLIRLFFMLKCVWSFAKKRELKKVMRCLVHGPLLIQTNYVYDSHGRKLEEQTCFIGLLHMKKVLTYDERKQKATETEYRSDGSIQSSERYTYQYDSHGNWVEQIISHSLPFHGRRYDVVIYRSIGYFSEF